jgi:hypothetical protein
MNQATAQLPGLYFTRTERVAQASPLRSDVAGFVGRARRGPVGQRVRVEGWNDYQRWFGGLDGEAFMPFALRGYFENGGQVAHVVRTGPHSGAGAAQVASVMAPALYVYGGYRIEASSPGAWANRTRIHLRYRRDGISGGAELDLTVVTPGEPPEYLTGLLLGAPDDDGTDPLQRQVASRSTLIRVVPDASVPPLVGGSPRRLDWDLVLGSGLDADPSPVAANIAYVAALQALNDEPEVALLALPDLYRDLEDPDALDLLAALMQQADSTRDRLLLVDAPYEVASANGVSSAAMLVWIDDLRGVPRKVEARAAAAYYPWLRVPDPLGGIADPLRAVPPCGHVAGVISRLDRERGPHHTPANASMSDALDLATRLQGEEQMQICASGINLLRCSSGNGMLVWGGSTLARIPRDEAAQSRALDGDHFIACRRLIHRLVRAIRRVAEPLVFDTNGPEMWLAFVRAVTSVLLEAYRGGALKGERPADAFYVQCDGKTNPPEAIDQGVCVCEIGVAPVAPMEFIVFRVALDREGALEVFES